MFSSSPSNKENHTGMKLLIGSVWGMLLDRAEYLGEQYLLFFYVCHPLCSLSLQVQVLLQ